MKPDFVVSGPKNTKAIPEDESVAKYIIDKLKKRERDEIVSIDGVTKKVQTCGNLLEDSIKTVHLLKQLGVEKGDVVSVISENTIYFNVPLLATWCMGVTSNLINPGYTISEFRHALLISKPKVVLTSSTAIEKIQTLKEELEFLQEVILFEDEANITEGSCSSFLSLLKNISVDTNAYKPDLTDPPNTGCLIMLSSGTTGLPKGVVLTHRNLRYFYETFPDLRYCGFGPNDTLLGILPFSHIFGLLGYTGAMVASAKVVILKKFLPELFLSTIQEYRVNKLHLVPPVVLFLAKHDLVKKYDLSSVEDILCGASVLGKEVKDKVIERMGNLSFRQVYGGTETTGACTFLPRDSDKTGSIGKLMPELDATVKDLITGKPLGPMETGELCFKGPLIMKHYINIPNNTTIIDQDGFYHSGDVGYYDEEGYFYIVDRIKELIKYKGFQVSPAELEVLLLTHAAVKECGVIGKPDERAGQLPLAFVVLQPGMKVTEQELVDYVAERISSTKRLYGGVQFIEDIPKNSSGKILRKKLEQLLNCKT